MKLFYTLNKLNIVDINFSCSYLKNHTAKRTKPLRDIHFVLMYTIKQIIKDLLCIFNYRTLTGKYVFYYVSVNQYNSIYSLYEKLDNSILVSDSYKINCRMPMAIGCFFSILLAPRFHFLLNSKYKNFKDVIKKNYSDYFFIEGMYIWWFLYLKMNRPKCIIFSNDHLVWHRVLRIAAQENNIPTVYLQHASVTEKFPKLEFDLSLLEGKDAYNKYAMKGIFGKSELVGMTKYDKYFSDINNNKKVLSIGICTNLLDDSLHIEKLCFHLKSSFKNHVIILRPHPRDDRLEFYKQLVNKYEIQLSDSTKDISFEYLKCVDVNIAGESSIHLESVLMNVYPIYYLFNNSITDHYKYIENQLITDVFDNPDALIMFINKIIDNKSDVRDRAKYYVDTINTKYDGKSTDLAKSIIINSLG